VGEWESVFVKGDANGDLAAVVAVLLVFSVLGLGVGSAEALEMAVGDIVENDAAARVSYTVETTVLLSFALSRGSCSGVSMSAGCG
jgi:hypothetical protein